MGTLRPALAALLASAAAVVVCATEPSGPGSSRIGKAARIFGGRNATAHEFPSQVYIISRFRDGNGARSIFCGGTILSEKWVLTAAHCVNNSVVTVVGFGAANKKNLDYRTAARVIPHENYELYGRNDNNAMNDLGLVELQEPIALDGVSAVAAPLSGPQYSIPVGKGTIVIGWGRWSYDPLQIGASSTEVLNKLGVQVIKCPHDTPNVICVQMETGTGICDGDSGGPLLVNGIFYGVASYVDNIDEDPYLDPNLHCNEDGSWAVYMAVGAFRDWIWKHTGV